MFYYFSLYNRLSCSKLTLLPEYEINPHEIDSYEIDPLACHNSC